MDGYLQRSARAIEQATVSLPEETIARAIPGKWSIAEILEHLMLSFKANRVAVERVLASGAPRLERPGARQVLARVLVVRLGYFPRVRAPESATPRGAVTPAGCRAAILLAIEALDGTLEEAERRFGERTPLARHPYFGGLTATQWRRFHWRHTLHHLRQVRERSVPTTGA